LERIFHLFGGNHPDDLTGELESVFPHIRRFIAADEENTPIRETGQYPGSWDRDEGVVRNHHQIRAPYNPALVDLLTRCAHVCKYGCTPTLRAIAGGVLDFETLQKEGCSQNTACGFDALPTTAVVTNAIH
jgi:hypothetical protein